MEAKRGQGPLFVRKFMGLLDDITLGRYELRDSVLHRLDPRLKLCGLPLLVVVAFAGQSPLRLGGLVVLAAALVLLSDIEGRIWWRGIWALRWLLLFTLLLHLLLSPGKTLFGIAWLSQDGLLRGVLVCSQLVLAITFSSLLTLTTSPQEVARAFASLFAPLARFGVSVHEISTLLLLVLHFVPVLREEAIALVERFRGEGLDPSRGPLIARGRALSRMVAPLLLRLVDRADALARSVAAGEDVVDTTVALSSFWPPCRADLVALVAGVLCLTVIFGVL